jgi:hypothetical protein
MRTRRGFMNGRGWTTAQNCRGMSTQRRSPVRLARSGDWSPADDEGVVAATVKPILCATGANDAMNPPPFPLFLNLMTGRWLGEDGGGPRR